MKQRLILSLVALVTLVSSDAFASRAREVVIGNGESFTGATNSGGGALSWDSQYNIFFNPAYVNDFQNWAIIEKNGYGETAQGGFVTNVSNFNIGFFMNRVGAINSFIFDYDSTADMRPIDLIIGGDMGVKWGLGLTYAANSKSPIGPFTPGFPGGKEGVSDEDLTVRAGIAINDIEPFVSYKVIGSARSPVYGEGTADQSKHRGYAAGFRYRMGEWTPYAAYTVRTAQIRGNSRKATDQNMVFGAGRTTKLGEGARMIYSLSYVRMNMKNRENTGTVFDERSSMLPIDLAFEGDVTSWLTLRGGVQYRLMDRTAGGNPATQYGTRDDTTVARVGATVKIQKVDFDWAIGNGLAGDTNNIDSDTFSLSNGLFTFASLSYRW
jgi:hypothetical protein